MNELTIINLDGRLLVDSREVAEMTGKRHDHLLRDIDNYVKVLSESTAPNFGVSDFFIESSYQDSTGRTLKRYLLTRKGCEMVANKLTGKKGVLFTAAYVTKFEEMEQAIRNPYSSLSPEVKAIFFLDKKTQEIEIRVARLESSKTIDYGQQLELQNMAKRKVIEALGGKDGQAYRDNSLRGKVFSAIWKDYKDYFNIESYKNTLVRDLDKAREYISSWRPQGKLLREIEEANRQMSFS
jgi:Rha family phage regulatory protein